jgi:hypothetical protein
MTREPDDDNPTLPPAVLGELSIRPLIAFFGDSRRPDPSSLVILSDPALVRPVPSATRLPGPHPTQWRTIAHSHYNSNLLPFALICWDLLPFTVICSV